MLTMQELDKSACPYVTPGSIGPSGVPEKTLDSKDVSAARKNIWTTNEIREEGSHYDDNDSRPQPEYDMVFKQSVGVEDVYLGMNLKNPTTACCENLVVRIGHSYILCIIFNVKPLLRSRLSYLTQPSGMWRWTLRTHILIAGHQNGF